MRIPCSSSAGRSVAVEAARAGGRSSSSTRAWIASICSLGAQPVGAAGVDPGVELVEEPGDPDHEELVEVGGVDRAEAEPLQQRHLGSSASSSTRWLKSSQESSRLK